MKNTKFIQIRDADPVLACTTFHTDAGETYRYNYDNHILVLVNFEGIHFRGTYENEADAEDWINEFTETKLDSENIDAKYHDAEDKFEQSLEEDYTPEESRVAQRKAERWARWSILGWEKVQDAIAESKTRRDYIRLDKISDDYLEELKRDAADLKDVNLYEYWYDESRRRDKRRAEK